MKPLSLLACCLCMSMIGRAQYVYTIKADTVKITNNCDSAELVLQNHTQGVPGFLYNTGGGKTAFQRVLQKINDSIYILGQDTLRVSYDPNLQMVTNAGNVTTLPIIAQSISLNSVSALQPAITAQSSRKGYATSFYNDGDTMFLAIPTLPTGFFPGYNFPKATNTALGIDAMTNLKIDTITSSVYGKEVCGTNNTVIGDSAGRLMQYGNENTFVGMYAGEYTTDTAGGDGNFTGSLNFFGGAWAGRYCKYCYANVYIGQKAGVSDTVGVWNVCIGKQAGANNNAALGHNVMIGGLTGENTVGGYNTILGFSSGTYLRGDENIVLGSGSANDTMTELVDLSQTFIAGGDSAGSSINTVYFGKGPFSASPTAYTIQGTGGYGSNINGGNINIAGGIATGSGTPGTIIFQTSHEVSPGTDNNYETETARFQSVTGTSYGGLGIMTYASTGPNGPLEVRDTVRNQTTAIDPVALFSDSTASFNVSSNQFFFCPAVQIIAKASHSGGSGKLVNAALYLTSSSADSNFALITGSGNVGIGTFHPQQLLDIAGNTNVQGQIAVNTLKGQSASLSVTNGAGMGTGGSVGGTVTGNNVSGLVTITTGSSGISGGANTLIATINLTASFPNHVYVTLTPANNTTAGFSGIFVVGQAGGSSDFEIETSGTLTASTVYAWYYSVSGD